MMGKRAKIILISMVLVLIITCLVTFGLIIKTIDEIPHDRLKKLTSQVQEEGYFFYVEQDSLVLREHFYNYNLFANTQRTNTELKNFLMAEGILAEGSNFEAKLHFQKEIKLNNLIKNDCQDVNCFQSRMSFSQIPSVLWRGLIGVEDNRFISHGGVDFRSIARALIQDLKHFSLVQGGSTLTQQLVKNLFYSNKKRISRKLKEIIVAFYIENNYGKDDILEAYFNEVFWGVLQGVKIKGVYAASLFYFSKKPHELSQFESAILISLLKGPSYYHPLKHLVRLKTRASIVYEKLIELSLFSADGVLWTESHWSEWIKELEKKELLRSFQSFWYLGNIANEGLSDYEKFSFVSSVDKALLKLKKMTGDSDIAVKAVMGNINSKKAEEVAFFKYYSKPERLLEVAINEERHQVGSTLKPIIYSIFQKLGKKLSDIVETGPVDFILRSGKWSPREAHNITESEVSLSEALLKSYNRPVLRVARELGFKQIEKDLLDFIPRLKVPLSEYPAQLLGATELSLSELARIYIKFVYNECDRLNNENGEEGESLLLLLSDPKATTVRTRVGLNVSAMRFFGKTGTSNNGYDNWFVFLEGNNLGIIWVGTEGIRNRPLRLYGSSTSFLIFQDYILSRGKRFSELDCALIP